MLWRRQTYRPSFQVKDVEANMEVSRCKNNPREAVHYMISIRTTAQPRASRNKARSLLALLFLAKTRIAAACSTLSLEVDHRTRLPSTDSNRLQQTGRLLLETSMDIGANNDTRLLDGRRHAWCRVLHRWPAFVCTHALKEAQLRLRRLRQDRTTLVYTVLQPSDSS